MPEGDDDAAVGQVADDAVGAWKLRRKGDDPHAAVLEPALNLDQIWWSDPGLVVRPGPLRVEEGPLDVDAEDTRCPRCPGHIDVLKAWTIRRRLGGNNRWQERRDTVFK